MQVADVVSRAEILARDAGIKIEKIAVIGDSAGGALLCGALHHLAEEMQYIPSAAVLLYPVLDASLEYESYTRFATGFHLTTARVRWYWEQYVGIPFQEIQHRSWDPYLSPIRSKQLHKFPPTMLISAECDPLRDEGEAFVQSLKHHGVRVEYLDVPGHVHGFMRFRKVLDDPNWGPDAIVERMRSFLLSAFSRG
jgi:acetyl esterase